MPEEARLRRRAAELRHPRAGEGDALARGAHVERGARAYALEILLAGDRRGGASAHLGAGEVRGEVGVRWGAVGVR